MQGHSWSIGGDPDAQTVATFLRFYTPDIVGASLGNKSIEVILIRMLLSDTTALG